MAEKKTDKARKGVGGWIFLLATAAIYLGIYVWKPVYAEASFGHFAKMARDIAPILLLVFVFLWALELVQGMKDRLAGLVGHDSGVKGWLVAVVGGVLSHGPVYAWYPLLQSLQKRGMRPALMATFLYARSIKLPWLPLMAHYFGMGYMLILTAYIACFSVLNGWLVERMIGSGGSGGQGD